MKNESIEQYLIKEISERIRELGIKDSERINSLISTPFPMFGGRSAWEYILKKPNESSYNFIVGSFMRMLK